MSLTENQRLRLKEIPGIDTIILKVKESYPLNNIPESVFTKSARKIIENLRKDIINQKIDLEEKIDELKIAEKLKNEILIDQEPNFKRVINGTGVVVHTNLGRSLLASEVADFVRERATCFSNLELDLSTGKRGLRYSLVEELVCEIIGCEAAMIVNNNAAAVLLCLDTFANGKEVVVSRGELVEIGGSFRIPDVMEKSGAVLKEVGTTNRTHLKDYLDAFDDEKTAMFLKVHTSNFDVIGFTSEVPLKDLKPHSEEKNLILMEDLGSGTFTDLSKFGLPKEPTVQDSVNSGADLVTFSGDKLLGGPQAGVIAGKKELIEKIRKNQLTRALRIDKMTLAALEMTLRIYRDPEKAISKIPTLRMLSFDESTMKVRAREIEKLIKEVGLKGLSTEIFPSTSRAGGGSLPETGIPTTCVGIEIENISAVFIEKFMRKNNPPIMGRIEADKFILDPRTIQDEEEKIIASAFKNLKQELE